MDPCSANFDSQCSLPISSSGVRKPQNATFTLNFCSGEPVQIEKDNPRHLKVHYSLQQPLFKLLLNVTFYGESTACVHKASQLEQLPDNLG